VIKPPQGVWFWILAIAVGILITFGLYAVGVRETQIGVVLMIFAVFLELRAVRGEIRELRRWIDRGRG